MNSRRANTQEAFQTSLREIERLFDGVPDLSEVAPVNLPSPSIETAEPMGFSGDPADDDPLEPRDLEP